VAGVARGDIDLHFVWQVALVARLGPVGAAAVCAAGVAFGSIDVHSVWQVWHVVTLTFTLSGRWPYWCAWVPLAPRLFLQQAWHLEASTSICVAGVAFGDMDLYFVWQAWHLWHRAGSGWLLVPLMVFMAAVTRRVEKFAVAKRCCFFALPCRHGQVDLLQYCFNHVKLILG